MLLKIKWCHFSLFILFRDFYKDIIILSFSFQNEKIREFMLNNLKFQIYPIPFVSLDTKLESHNIFFYGLNEDSYKTDRFFQRSSISYSLVFQHLSKNDPLWQSFRDSSKTACSKISLLIWWSVISSSLPHSFWAVPL